MKSVIIVLLMHVISVFGVMRIISMQPLNSTLTSAKILRDGEILWSEMVNARGGVLINGTYHPVELISIDIGAPTDAEMSKKAAEIIRAVANGTYGEVHAMLAPFSSSLTEAHAIEAEKHKLLTCAAGTCRLHGHACKELRQHDQDQSNHSVSSQTSREA